MLIITFGDKVMRLLGWFRCCLAVGVVMLMLMECCCRGCYDVLMVV